MTHATFGALVAGVQPAIPPPWERDLFNGSADELFDQRFGTMLGQSRDSAGRVEYLTLPRLVRGLAQVNEVAAGGGFTLAVRKACRPGSYLDPTSGDCGLCPAGHYSDELSTLECKPCPGGQAATTAGSSRCTPCEPGYYASDLGTEECSACPAGTFVGFGGAASADQCVPARPGPTRTRLVPPRVPRAARERTRSCHRRLRVSLALLRRTCRGFGREVSTIACRVPGARSGRTAARLRATRARLERTPTPRVARFAGRVPWVSTGRVPATRGASRARLVRTAKNSRRRRRLSALPAPRVTSATRSAPPRARRARRVRTRPVTGPRSASGVPLERTV